jgi:predicted Zn-dependent protease
MFVRWCVSISVQVGRDGKRERGSSGGGGRFGYDWFLGDVDGEVAPTRGRKKPCAWRW